MTISIPRQILFFIFLSITFILAAIPCSTIAGSYLNSAHGNSTIGVDRSSIDATLSDYSIGNCAHCHEQHASINGSQPLPNSGVPSPFLGFSLEQNLCFECHDGNPAPLSTDVASQFNLLTYKHGQVIATGLDYMTDYDNRHDPKEKSSLDFSIDNRHSECMDCHNPHKATDANPLLGASGILVTNGANWSEPSHSTNTVEISDPLNQYQVCFKCHSGWAGTGSGTSQALEFNTNNASFHNVEGDITPPSSDTYGNFNTTYVYKMMPRYNGYANIQLRNVAMVCSDCHGNTTTPPLGIHGSSRASLLKAPQGSPYTQWNNTITVKNRGNCWCFNCHDPNFNNSGFSTGNQDWHLAKHNEDSAYCQTCHSAVPHGWKRSKFLIYTYDNGTGTIDPAPYNNAPNTGLAPNMIWQSSGSWHEKDCHGNNPESVGSCG